VNKKVEPKIAALKKAEEVLEETEKQLAIVMEKVRLIEEGITKLQEKLKEKEDYKAELEKEKFLCEERMGRAMKLIEGLGDEEERWIIMVAETKTSLKNAVGDILLSSGTSEPLPIVIRLNDSDTKCCKRCLHATNKYPYLVGIFKYRLQKQGKQLITLRNLSRYVEFYYYYYYYAASIIICNSLIYL
jgi:hypothetical protein